ncbi:MAG TPA: recombinase family protein [Thermoanaerobaculia bacterium]|jgi:DNA invertase Pin-like site-specific DNA recombinase|nr:recombinase family protein [Thermoanaerobaculia bacterium]
MPRIAIYARKSTESDDRQAASIESQLHWAVKRCAELGLRDPLIFTESQSAKIPGRPEFARMVSLVEGGGVDTVVCWKADRLSRNARDGGTVLWLVESKKLTQIITSDRTYTAEPDAELMLTIELGMSVKYSQDLAKNIRRGIDAKLRRGEWSFFAPLGYKNVRLSADRATIAVDEELAPYIQRLFALAASGTYSLSDLVRLTRDTWKLRIPRRRPNSTARGISHTTVDHILRNPFYYGKLVVKGEVYEGVHPPLVSKETFDRVQLMMKHRAKAAPRPKRNVFTLSGLLWCGLCGRRLTGYRKRKKSGQESIYYVCSNRIRGRCAQPLVHETKVFSDLYRDLFRMAVRPEEYEDAARILQAMRERETEAIEKTTARADAALRDVASQQKRLLNLLIEGVIERDDYDLKRRELEARRAEEALTIATASLAHGEKFDRAAAFLDALVDADKTFERSTAEERRTLLRLFGLEFKTDGEKVLMEAQKPAAAVMGRHEFQEWWRLWADIIPFFGGGQAREQAAE